jgi:hypothetical protein
MPSFNPDIEHGKIESYRVVVKASGMGDVEAGLPGDAKTGVIEGVPVGGGRGVFVEAINKNGIAIYAGEEMGVKVGGGTTEVHVDMEQVPIFANVSNGAVVHNTRLVFRIFADPSSPVDVVGERGGESFSLSDSVDAGIYADESTWLANISPPLLDPGAWRFTCRNSANGRSSSIDVRLVDGRSAVPAPVYASSYVDARASAVLW